MNPIRQEARCSSALWTTIGDVPTGGGIRRGRPGHDPYCGRDARAMSAALDAYGISRGDAYICGDFWSVSRKRGDRRSLRSSAVPPGQTTPCGREIADLLR